MATLAVEAVCCAGQACCGCLCGVCMRVCGTNNSQNARLGYLFFFILAVFFSILFLYEGSNMVQPFEDFGFVDCSGDDKSVCLGVQTVYRVSFSMLIFHIVLLVLSLSGPVGKVANEGCWMMKFIILSCFFIATFFINNAFFDVYREFARYASVIYLIVQIVVLIDFSYAWNDAWVENYENSGGSNFWMFWLFFFSGIMWVIALTTNVLNYYWFSEADGGCPLNIFLITQTLSIGVIFTLVSVSNFVDHGSLLTSSSVNLYCTYLCWAGLSNQSVSTCNQYTDSRSTIFEIVFGLIPVVITLLYIGFQQRNSSVKAETPIREIAAPMLSKEDEDNEDDTYESSGRRMVVFHGLMIAISIYLAMLCTNWGAAYVDGHRLSSNDGSIWVQFSAQWLTDILYIWTLIAPRVCPGREFS